MEMTKPKPQFKFDPAETIEQAIQDLLSFRDDRRVSINMNFWFADMSPWRPDSPPESLCAVCLAGASLYRIFERENLLQADPVVQLRRSSDHPYKLYREGLLHAADFDRVMFLNSVRVGHTRDALGQLMGRTRLWNTPDQLVSVYEQQLIRRERELAILDTDTLSGLWVSKVAPLGGYDGNRSHLSNIPIWYGFKYDQPHVDNFVRWLQHLADGWRAVAEEAKQPFVNYIRTIYES